MRDTAAPAVPGEGNRRAQPCVWPEAIGVRFAGQVGCAAEVGLVAGSGAEDFDDRAPFATTSQRL